MDKRVYIFGAHSRARTLGAYLMSLCPGIKIAAYLTNNDEENPTEIDGVPVLHMDADPVVDRSLPVYLATRAIFHERIASFLTRIGMEKIIPVTPSLDMELRNRYLKKDFADRGREFRKLGEYSSICVYVAKSTADRLLKGKYILRPYEKVIQVGAALTKERIADITDDTGFHISDRNRQFCELTALYWIWKNSKEDIVGLEHYRRHFLLPERWQEKMETNRIDVILPTPLYVAPCLSQNYKNRHRAEDWEVMLEELKLLYPEEYQMAVDFFDTGLYSPCNMFIMRKDVLNAMCSWLFPVLFACTAQIGEREDAYQNRYPGFLSERLITFFFAKNRARYKVVYADKNFLE